MRLIAHFSEMQKAELFSEFLTKEKIKNSYQKALDSYQLWVDHEEDLDLARAYYEQYLSDPSSKEFIVKKPQIQSKPQSLRRFFSLTAFLILFCSLFFVWNDRQTASIEKTSGAFAAEVLWTPLFKLFLFDDPISMEKLQNLIVTHQLSADEGVETKDPFIQKQVEEALSMPSFGGLIKLVFEKMQTGSIIHPMPLFEKISQGQVWRLFSPCLLHRDFWHLFFNMSWLWGLGLQIESRLKIPRTLLLILILGIFSNLSQYLMSGPFFLGFSGVIVGLATFIWVRQKKNPWEGYPMQKAMSYFLFFGVAAMFLLGLISFVLQLFSFIDVPVNIANSAHISGGLAGYLLGRSQFFAKRFS